VPGGWGALETITAEEVVARYTGSKRRAYEQALRSLGDVELHGGDARVEVFVKAEKTPFGLKKGVDPRIICARSKRYNIKLLQYLVPVERLLYHVRGETWWGVPRTRIFAKGLNLKERAELLERKFRHFERPLVVELDCSRFDGHVDREMLRLEHRFYLSLFSGDRDLARLLEMQLRTKGKSMNGVMFAMDGKRATGDPNTGCGNSLLEGAMIRSGMQGLGVKWDMLGDGDNVVLFLEEDTSARVLTHLSAHFKRCSQVLTVDNRTSVLDRVTFCRMRPLMVGGVRRLARPWTSVLGGMLVSHRHFREAKGGMAIAKAIVRAELDLSLGVPIIDPCCRHLLSLMDSVVVGRVPVDTGVYQMLRWFEGVTDPNEVLNSEPPAREVDVEDRGRFADAWGVEPSEQLAIESRFRSYVTAATFDLSRITVHGDETLVCGDASVVCDPW